MPVRVGNNGFGRIFDPGLATAVGGRPVGSPLMPGGSL
jgi:hypothetical protein